MKEAIRKELQESLEEMLKLFSPYAAAFRDGKGLEICTKADFEAWPRQKRNDKREYKRSLNC